MRANEAAVRAVATVLCGLSHAGAVTRAGGSCSRCRLMVTAQLAALTTDPDVRAALVEALTAPQPPEAVWSRHLSCAEWGQGRTGHRFDAFCDLCSGEPDRILDRILAALTPEAS